MKTPWYQRLWRSLTGGPVDPPEKKGSRGYDGAGTGRRLEDWITSGASGNALVAQGGRLLRQRSRDLVRNAPMGSRARREFASLLVGNGIVPRCATGDRKLDQAVNTLWKAWEKVGNARRGVKKTAAVGVYALQSQAAGAWFDSGEVLIRRRFRRMEDGLPVPLQVEVLESDHLATEKTGRLSNGGRIIQGVELDPLGGLEAYHLYREHPGESEAGFTFGEGNFAGVQTRIVRVSAEAIAHVYEELRVGQLRGIPWLAPVIVAMKDGDDAADAERVRMKIAAAMTAFVFGDDTEEEGVSAKVEDYDGNPVEVFEPGLIAYVRGGKDIKLPNPVAATQWESFWRTTVQQIAIGAGPFTYETLSGDLSRVNFSSIRKGEKGVRRMVDQYRSQMFIPLACDPIWRWFIDGAKAAGLIPRFREDETSGALVEIDYPVRWIDPPWEEVDQTKQAAADLSRMRSGEITLFDVIVKNTGRDPLDVLDEHARIKEECERRGLRFESLPFLISETSSEKTEEEEEEEIECPECGVSVPANADRCPECYEEIENI